MRRQLIAYAPANTLPGLVSFASIYALTRLLSPGSYGDYSLAFSAAMVVHAAVFYPLTSGMMRLYPVAERRDALDDFLAGGYATLLLLGAAVGGLALGLALAAPLPHALRLALLLAVPLTLLRGLVTLNQSLHRMRERAARYNLIECGGPIVGLAAAIAFALRFGPDAASVMGGLVVGMAACVLIDLRLLAAALARGRIRRGAVVDLLRFGWPLALTFLTSFLLQYADRFVVGSLGSASMLGIYAVAYSLVERPTTLLCTSVSTATYAMAVRATEAQGAEAGQRQAGRNGVALLALAAPACLGLMLCGRPIAAVLVGPEYRSGVAVLIPIMAATALARGVGTHFVDHAFHLARRPALPLRVYAPAAAANLLIDIVAVPAYGAAAAAWAALACQLAALAATWTLGRRVFPMPLPARDLAAVAAALGGMALVLLALRAPATPAGLAEMVGTGGLTYGAILGATLGRGWLLGRLRPARLGAGG